MNTEEESLLEDMVMETPATKSETLPTRQATIGAVFHVTDEDRLCFVLEQNGYKVEKASPCLWSVTKIACPHGYCLMTGKKNLNPKPMSDFPKLSKTGEEAQP